MKDVLGDDRRCVIAASQIHELERRAVADDRAAVAQFERQFGVRVKIGPRPIRIVSAQQRGRRQVADHRAGADSLSITDAELPPDRGRTRAQLCASALELPLQRSDQPSVDHAL